MVGDADEIISIHGSAQLRKAPFRHRKEAQRAGRRLCQVL